MIKRFTFISLSVLLFVRFVHADIDSQIEKIQNAPIEERFILMNAFKKEIAHMHEIERIDAIRKLKSITKSENGESVLKALRDHVERSSHRERETIQRHEINEKYEQEDRYEAEDHIENDAENHIDDATEDHIEDETEDHIEDETEDHIE
ncbi:MAG: hypothetical protein RL113_1294, partial [Pseudomonadota bacterium]